MTDTQNADLLSKATQWWSTSIIDMKPGSIRFRGYAIEELIGNVTFPQMIWLMLRGDIPTISQAVLLEAALVAAVDHGPQAPSIAIARMAVTCGLPLNGAVASAVNVLDDVHGGAGEQCMELYSDVHRRMESGETSELAVASTIDDFISRKGPVIPGFGHRFHPIDPRSPRLLAIVDRAVAEGSVSGCFASISRAIETELERRKGRKIPMNIDGATAVVFSELGLEPPLGRGLFILSRSVGILAHAWEQTQAGERIKGPMPPAIPYSYLGKSPRNLEKLRT